MAYSQTESACYTVRRASTGTVRSAIGFMSDVAVNTSRIDGLTNGLLVESTKTNLITNSSFSGTVVTATAGSGIATDPTNMTFTQSNGLSRDILGFGIDSTTGENYVLLRIYGTSTSILASISFDNKNNCPVVSTSTYTGGVSVSLYAGSLSGVNNIGFSLNEYASGVLNVASYSTNYVVPNSSNQRATFTKGALVGTALQSTTNFIQPGLRITVQTGVAIDVTLKLSSPSFVIGPYEGSIIRQPSGVIGAITRQADDIQMTSYNFSKEFPNIGTTGGSIEFGFVMSNSPLVGRDNGLWRLDVAGAGENNKIVLTVPGVASGAMPHVFAQVWSGGVEIVNLDLGSFIPGSQCRSVFGFSPGNYVGCLNGGTPVVSNASGYPSGLNEFFGGRATSLPGSIDTNGAQMLNGTWTDTLFNGSVATLPQSISNSDPTQTQIGLLAFAGLVAGS